MGLLDPLQRVMRAGEVRLRGEGEEVVVIAGRVGQVARQQALVHAQIGRDARHVGRLRAPGAGELADAVDRIVVVEGEQEAIAGAERVGLADEPQRAGRVGREDRDVLLRGGFEELEHARSGALQHLGARSRGWVDRVRVAEHVLAQQRHVLDQLRLGVQPAAGVVEVDVAASVQAREVAAAELVEHGRVVVARMVASKRGFRRRKRLRLGMGDAHVAHPPLVN